MKSQTLIGIAAVALVGLSACSQNNTPKQAHNRQSSHYLGNGYEVRFQKVIYRQENINQQNKQQQVAPYQQVRRQNVEKNPVRSEESELYAIGDQIFKNEAGGDIYKLVHWNEGEDFAAMGIGHWTWYPSGRHARYGNSFPGLLDYLQNNGVNLPQWVRQARFEGAPWRSRSELMRVKNSPEIRQFAQLLYQTRNLQAKYIMDRAMRAMPKLVKTTLPHLRSLVANNINSVANSHGGRYVLVDYINFKGEGLKRNGGYKGQNWGLLQVLEEMNPAPPGPQALNHFADAAMRVLERRVRNSPRGKNEKRWLNGWRNRTETYRNPV